MPHRKSAKKRLRQNEDRRELNRSKRSAMRTQLRRVREAVTAGEIEKADKEADTAFSDNKLAAAKVLLEVALHPLTHASEPDLSLDPNAYSACLDQKFRAWNTALDELRQEEEQLGVLKSALAAAEARAEAINALEGVTIEANAGEEGKLFGSVGTRDIAEAVTAAGCEVDKSEVRLPEGALRELGEYEISIQVHGDVTAVVALSVVPEA